MVEDTRLSVRGLGKQFGSEFEVSDVNLDVGRDKIVALLGPSGCGKTTILRCIAGVETPDTGEIVIGDEVVWNDRISKPPERRNVGMIYQNYAIWPHKSVYQNVVFPLNHASHDIDPGEYEKRVTNVLELMEIGDLKTEPATDLSGGQQQRTALARALVHDPDLVLLDEPLSNLDKELRKHMRYELQRIQHELGVSMLYVTHDQEEAFYLADEVLVMRDGEIVECGEPEKLYERPDSAFTRGFIGDRNRFYGRIESTAEGDRVVSTDLVEFPLSNADYVSDGITSGEVVCFLKPDDISIGQFAGEVDGRIELRGTVIAEGLLGETYEVTVGFDSSEIDLVVHTETYREFERGDDIRLQFQPMELQVYGATDS
jgi:iron(III) transport system ATP-binding protein